MQENEFEKRLQQKLELLQVQPTGEVWEKIKVDIAEKKRKRRIVFFFLAICFLLTGLFFIEGFNLFNNEQAQPVSTFVEPTQKTTATQRNAENNKNSSMANTNTAASATGTIEVEKNTIALVNDNNENVQYTGSSLRNNTSAGITEEKFRSSLILKRKIRAVTKSKVTTATPAEEDYVIEIPSSTSVQNTNESVVSDNKTVKNEQVVLNETIKTVDQLKEDIKSDESESRKEKVKKSEKNQRSKWGWGLSFSGGISSASYNNMDKSIAYTADGLGSTPPGPTAGPSTYYPSDAKAGFGFSTGVQVYRVISGIMKLTTGLQYQFISTSQKTGEYVGRVNNSNADYRYGATNTYKTRYHYLSIPFGTSVRLFDIGKREISLDAGINFSRLIKTNTLAFDTSLGNYYYNTSLLNSTFIGLSGSLAINLAGKNKPGLYIGPEFYYSITPLANTGMYANTHSRYFGIKLQKNLTK